MNASVTMRQAGQWKKMAEAQLSFEKCKTILKWCSKFENMVEVQWQWRREHATDPQTCLRIANIHDKLDTMFNVPQAVICRNQKCLDADGNHFEHLL